MTDTLETLAHALLDAARDAGAGAADVIAVDGTSIAVDVRGGALEQADRAEGLEFGLRVLLGKRQASVSASDPRPEILAEMARRAVAMAGENVVVVRVGLGRDDFDPVEQITEAGLRQFAFLIQQVALGDQEQPEVIGQRLDSLAGVGQ